MLSGSYVLRKRALTELVAYAYFQLFGMAKTRDLFIDTKGTFHAKMGSMKDRNGLDLTEAEDIKRGGKNTQKNGTQLSD